MHRPRVGVLRGGPSREYEPSLETGRNIISSIPEDDFDVSDIFISKDGVWHLNGVPIAETEVAERFDVLFNALHGQYGEDGTLQGLLDSLNARYTGSGKLASSMAINKPSAKKAFKMAGLKTPAHIVISVDEDGLIRAARDEREEVYRKDDILKLAREIFMTFPQPAVFKPVDGGSSLGVRVVYGIDQIAEGLLKGLEEEESILVEEHIKGANVSCGVVEGFRNSDLYVLPPVEVVLPKETTFFDYNSKYSHKTERVCPGRFPEKVRNQILEATRIAHQTLGARHYSRSDFVVTQGGGIYILETNSIPKFNNGSLFEKSLEAVGSNLSELVTHLINLSV